MSDVVDSGRVFIIVRVDKGGQWMVPSRVYKIKSRARTAIEETLGFEEWSSLAWDRAKVKDEFYEILEFEYS